MLSRSVLSKTEQQTVLGWSLHGVQVRDRRWPTTRPPALRCAVELALGCSLACRVCFFRLWQANKWLEHFLLAQLMLWSGLLA